MNQQPLKFAVILTVLVIAIIAALSFKRSPEKEKKTAAAPRIIVNKPVVDVSAFDERLSRLTGNIEAAPQVEETAPAAAAEVNLDAPPPKLPEKFTTETTLEARPLAPLDPSDLPTDELDAGRVHRVRDGDTLASLADRFLGDASRAGEILDANRDKITNGDLLPIGLGLVIPPREKVAPASDTSPGVTAEDEDLDLVPVAAPSAKPQA